MTLFLLLIRQPGKNMSVLAIPRPGFIAGKPVHLIAVAKAQQLGYFLLVVLGCRNFGLLPCDQRIQSL